jgi:hypothetical protein
MPQKELTVMEGRPPVRRYAVVLATLLDFARGHGFFVMPNPKLARFALPFGQIYFASMVVRYAVRMTLHPEARWLGGTIPIVFHWVLASYVMAFGHFHRTRTLPKVS